MANKFVIKRSDVTRKYWWELMSDNKFVLANGKEFETEKQCREDIAKLKKIITRYTKVELEQ